MDGVATWIKGLDVLYKILRKKRSTSKCEIGFVQISLSLSSFIDLFESCQILVQEQE
jgi:hypothetical protein